LYWASKDFFFMKHSKNCLDMHARHLSLVTALADFQIKIASNLIPRVPIKSSRKKKHPKMDISVHFSKEMYASTAISFFARFYSYRLITFTSVGFSNCVPSAGRATAIGQLPKTGSQLFFFSFSSNHSARSDSTQLVLKCSELHD
jgi:hypothetical protein